MSAERTVARNAAWLVLQPLVMNVLSLAATGYIARQLGSSEFGRFNLAYTFIAMFAPLTNMGLRALTVRHVAQNREGAGEFLGKVLVLRVLLAVACSVLIIAAAPWSGGSTGTQAVIAVAAVGMILTTAGAVFTDGYESFERMRPPGLASMAGAILLTLTSVLVVWQGGGIRGMAYAYVLGPLCTLTLLWLWARRQPFCPRPRWDPAAMGGLLRQGAPFFGIAILDVVSVRIDVLVLARLLGDGNLGSYTAAMSLVDRAMILSDGAGGALLPTLAHLAAQLSTEVIPLLRKATLWLLIISLPVAVMTAVLAPLIIGVIFGSQYAAAAPILAVAIWRLPAMCMAMLEGHSLFAVGRQDLVLRTGAIAMLLSIALIYPMVRLFGPMGGAVALALRPLLTFLLRMPAMMHHFPKLWPWSQLGRVTAALGLMVVPLSYVPSLSFGLEAVLYVLAAGALYLLCLALLKVLPVEAILDQLARRLGKNPTALALAGEGKPGRK